MYLRDEKLNHKGGLYRTSDFTYVRRDSHLPGNSVSHEGGAEISVRSLHFAVFCNFEGSVDRSAGTLGFHVLRCIVHI